MDDRVLLLSKGKKGVKDFLWYLSEGKRFSNVDLPKGAK